MNKNQPLVSIITINFNDPDVTCELLESIYKSNYDNVEIIVVDNASAKVSPDKIQVKFPEVRLVRSSTNLGFAGGNNLGLKYAQGDYIFFLNNDTVVMPQTIEVLLYKLIRDKCLGAVSPKIKFYSDPKIIQYAGSTPVNPLTISNRHIGNHQADNGQHDMEVNTSYAHGAAMMVPKTVIDKVGMMPESYFLYYEELDWCEMIKNAGYTIRYIPSSTVFHKESMSIGKESIAKFYYQSRNRILYARRNHFGWKFFLSMIYISLISIPKNILFNLKDKRKIKAYVSGLLWNLSNGKLDVKPF